MPILSGVGGPIYKEYTINALRQLGVSLAPAMTCALELLTNVTNQLHTTMTTCCWLEHNQPG
eukprot:354346-Chlamydomonas_euryale.AAC.3